MCDIPLAVQSRASWNSGTAGLARAAGTSAAPSAIIMLAVFIFVFRFGCRVVRIQAAKQPFNFKTWSLASDQPAASPDYPENQHVQELRPPFVANAACPASSGNQVIQYRPDQPSGSISSEAGAGMSDQEIITEMLLGIRAYSRGLDIFECFSQLIK